MKPYPAYKDSGIEWLGEIPAGWNKNKLGRITEVKGRIGWRGYTVNDLRAEGEGVLVIGATQIDKLNRIDLSNSRFLSREKYEESPEIKLFGGEILIVKVGATIGKVALVPPNLGEATINPNVMIVRNFPLNNEYLFYYFNSPPFKISLDLAKSAGAQDAINQDFVNQLQIPIPPLPEQRAIAAFLDYKTRLIDTYVAKKQQQIERLQVYRTALINQAVTKGLNPDTPMKDSGIEWLGEIPAHWGTAKLKYIADFKSGDSITSTDIDKTGLFPVYGGNGIRGYTDRYTNNGHFILIGRQGALCGNIHYAEGCFWASEHAIVVYLQPDYVVFWLGELLKIMNLNQYSIAAAQPGLAVETIKNLAIPVPPKSEQQNIANYIKSQTAKIDTLIATTQRQIDRLQSYRTALISDAVTGKIDVRDEVINEHTEEV